MTEIDVDPGSYERWHHWLRLKRIQVRVRTYLSLVVSLALAFLVTVREWGELSRAVFLLSLTQWLLLVVAAGAVLLGVRFRLR
jgi:flagellar biosynthesis protein FliR